MFGFKECCDATSYAHLSQQCLKSFSFCWNEIRPIGATILSAITFTNGLVWVNHFLLISFSFFIVAFEGRSNLNLRQAYLSSPKKCLPYLFNVFLLILLLELFFLGLASVNLTDVSAGIFAAIAIVAFSCNKTLLFSIASAFSILTRAMYLYPMILLITYMLFEGFFKKVKLRVVFNLIPFFLLTFYKLLLN